VNASALLSALAGYDQDDLYSADVPVDDYLSGLESVRAPRIGLVRRWFFEESDAETRLKMEQVAQLLARKGATVEEVDPGIRSKAKMVNFGIVYGLQPFGLSDRLQIPIEDAEEFIGGQAGGGPLYQFNVTNVEAGSCIPPGGFNLGDYHDVNDTSPGTRVCDVFRFDDSSDEIRIDILLRVPSDSLTGPLTDTMTATIEPA
jgi:hypothetical protein